MDRCKSRSWRKTAEVSFKATINSDTKTSVTNKAVIDGNKPTEEVETKVANITGTKTVDKTEAKSWRYINIYNYINK